MNSPLPSTVIADLAGEALRQELATFPKPGLVSFVDNGSHPDMDAACFLDSIEAITPSFAQMAEAGRAGATLKDLQEIGLAAEKAMLQTTGGRNTHRGAIFCLGLLAAAAGCRHQVPGLTLGEIVKKQWGRAIPSAKTLPPDSIGIAMCQRYQQGGVREEASRGFPSVFVHGLPALRACLPLGREAACVHTFFAIMENCEDTTLLHRGGRAGQIFAHDAARNFLQKGGVACPDWLTTATEIHHEFVRRNLTAGGVADLLAATLFVEDISRFS